MDKQKLLLGFSVLALIVLGSFWYGYITHPVEDAVGVQSQVSTSITENTSPCVQLSTTGECILPTPPPARLIRKVVLATTTSQGEKRKLDEHLVVDETFKSINFCGDIYLVKQILIDGVDVMQRIAELVTSEEISGENGKQVVKEICEGVYAAGYPPAEYNVTLMPEIFDYGIDFPNYLINLDTQQFGINAKTKEIFKVVSGYADAQKIPIGSLN
jgi:hypothetical protein